MTYQVKMSQILSKTFLRPEEMPETEIADGALNHSFQWPAQKKTRYYRLRTGRASWNSPGCGCLPTGLDSPLAYWVTPFADKPRRPPTSCEICWRTVRFRSLHSRFIDIILAIARSPSGWIGPPAYGILLVDGAREVCILLDGHHRVGALAALGRMDQDIPVEIPADRCFDWEATLRSDRFSESDIRKWWNHCFSVVYGVQR